MVSFRSLLGYVRPYLWLALLAPALMALEVSMDLKQPRLLQMIVDVGIANSDLPYVYRVGWTMIVVALVGVLGGVGCTLAATVVGYRFGADIRRDLFVRVQELSFADLDRLETGRLVTRLTSDVDQVQEAMMMFLRILVRAPLLMVGSLVMAVITSPRLSVLLVVVCPLVAIVFEVVSRSAHSRFSLVQDWLDRFNVRLLENLAGVRAVKAFGREEHERKRFGVVNHHLMTETAAAEVLVASAGPVMMLLVNLGVVGVVWYGGLQVHQGNILIGQILAFINYLMQLLQSMMMVGVLTMRVARADASAARIREVLDTEPTVVDQPGAAPVESIAGSVSFDQVSFRYGVDGRPVLRDLSFTVEPGWTVGVIGATGSGKSTLVQLVPRLYDVTAGAIRIDGRDVRDYRQADLHRLVAMVMQESVLFSGSIAENLRFGRPEATDAELREAARAAQAADFIEALPEDYETVIGQRGVDLSGGQKQRLAVARALVQRPAILLLDDCTSALDAATEAEIVAALDAWPEAATRFVVTHRVQSVLIADLVLVLADGELAGAGTHQELLADCPVYREIVETQLSVVVGEGSHGQ